MSSKFTDIKVDGQEIDQEHVKICKETGQVYLERSGLPESEPLSITWKVQEDEQDPITSPPTINPNEDIQDEIDQYFKGNSTELSEIKDLRDTDPNYFQTVFEKLQSITKEFEAVALVGNTNTTKMWTTLWENKKGLCFPIF